MTVDFSLNSFTFLLNEIVQLAEVVDDVLATLLVDLLGEVKMLLSSLTPLPNELFASCAV